MRSKEEIFNEFEDNLSKGYKEDNMFLVMELLFDIRNAVCTKDEVKE